MVWTEVAPVKEPGFSRCVLVELLGRATRVGVRCESLDRPQCRRSRREITAEGREELLSLSTVSKE